MTSALDQKGLEADVEAVAEAIYNVWGNYPACTNTKPWSVLREERPPQAESFRKYARAAIRAYLSTVIPAEIAGVVEKLRNPEGDEKLDFAHRLEAATLIERLAASQAEREEAARQIAPYLRWTIGPESPGHHATMPSAVATFMAAYGWDTEEKWHEARIRALIDQPSTEGGRDGA